MSRKKTIKSVKKLFSSVLSLILIFQSMQIIVYAINLDQNGDPCEEYVEPSVEESEWESEEITPEDAYVLSENTEKREEAVKHFLMSNGTILAAQYNLPIHFLTNDGYVDYDNTMIEVDESDVNIIDIPIIT